MKERRSRTYREKHRTLGRWHHQRHCPCRPAGGDHPARTEFGNIYADAQLLFHLDHRTIRSTWDTPCNNMSTLTKRTGRLSFGLGQGSQSGVSTPLGVSDANQKSNTIIRNLVFAWPFQQRSRGLKPWLLKKQQQPSHWSANKLSTYCWEINKRQWIIKNDIWILINYDGGVSGQLELTEGYQARTRLGTPGLWLGSALNLETIFVAQLTICNNY